MPAATQPASAPPCWVWRWSWVDGLWLVFLAALAALPPISEIHKQVILAGLALAQIAEAGVLARWPARGPTIAVGVKLALATLLIDHTGQVAINSSYYPIFYVPIVTAGMLFGVWATLAWTTLATAAYCAYLWPALAQYSISAAGVEELGLRVAFFFLLALIVNRFAGEARAQRDLYRHAAESLEESNRQLRQAQQEARRAERLAALGQMSAGLAHEIRNPLAVIKGSAEMLGRQLQTAPAVAAELAGYISSEVDRVNVLVARFLDFARPLRLERRAVDLAALLDRALADAGERWPQARIERDYRLQGVPALELDETLSERAFANLAANALEAMEGGGRLRVTAAPEEMEGQPGIRIVFQDTGPGVPAELREQIFNPFVTTKPTGVGLGLAIVAQIVDQHGGRLHLADEPPPGARFEVFFPYGHHPDRG